MVGFGADQTGCSSTAPTVLPTPVHGVHCRALALCVPRHILMSRRGESDLRSGQTYPWAVLKSEMLLGDWEVSDAWVGISLLVIFKLHCLACLACRLETETGEKVLLHEAFVASPTVLGFVHNPVLCPTFYLERVLSLLLC